MKKIHGNQKEISSMHKNYLNSSKTTIPTSHSIECHCTLPNKLLLPLQSSTIVTAKYSIEMSYLLNSTNMLSTLTTCSMVALFLITRYLYLEMGRLSQSLSDLRLTLNNVLRTQQESNEMDEAMIRWILQFAASMSRLRHDL